MAEKEQETAAPSLLATTFGLRREPLADVISSPDPSRHTSTLRSRTTTRQKKKTDAVLTPPRGTITSRKQRGAQRSVARHLLTPCKLESSTDADKAPPLTTMEEEEEEEGQEVGYGREKVAFALLPSDKTTTTTTDSCISERDSLLERLREKERQFDEKIAVLDETLSCAERGRAHRDNIITGLRADVARLREQLELTSGAKSQTEMLRERILKERTLALDEARAKVEDLGDRLLAKDRQIEQLKMELRQQNSALAAREQKKIDAEVTAATRCRTQQRHQSTMTTSGPMIAGTERERKRCERYAASLREMQNEVHGLEQSHCVIVKEKESLAEENHALRCKLEAIQEGMEARVSGAMKTMQKNLGHVRELQAEVMVTRLSMARLLRLLNELPEIRRYLRAEGIDEDLIFAGYRTGTGTKTPSTMAAAAGHKLSSHNDSPQRYRNGDLLVVAPETGVDDGIYGGNSLLQSCNVYLNGQWWKQLKDIINDESYFLRRAKINIGAMEDAVQCGGRGDGVPRVPSPRDVLQGRQHDKDFWIPYAVFVEAQKFKNRYFPSLNHECFYPFLIAINSVWRERMKHRVRTEMRRRLQEQQQQQQQRKSPKEMDQLWDSSAVKRDGTRLLSSSALTLWQQLRSLRSDVRRRVTGRNSLELFHLYDQLARCALQHLQHVQQEHAALSERYHYRHRVDSARAEMDVVDAHDDDDDDDDARMGDGEEDDAVNGSNNNNNNKHNNKATVLERALSALIDDTQAISERASSRIIASCRDLQQFLEALRDQQLQMGIGEQQHQERQQTLDENSGLAHRTATEHAPSTALLRIIDGVLDFIDEIQREVFTARDAISRCGARADERREILHDVSSVDHRCDDGNVDVDDRYYHDDDDDDYDGGSVGRNEDDDDDDEEEQQQEPRRVDGVFRHQCRRPRQQQLRQRLHLNSYRL